MWNIGDRVLAPWDGSNWLYPGTVRKLGQEREDRERKFYVRFDDGDKAWLCASNLTPLKIASGQRVFACRAGNRFFFTYESARITAVKRTRLRVRYSDNTQEWVTTNMIRFFDYATVRREGMWSLLIGLGVLGLIVAWFALMIWLGGGRSPEGDRVAGSLVACGLAFLYAVKKIMTGIWEIAFPEETGG